MDISTIKSENNVPKDEGNYAYWIFFMLGVGVLTPWNVLITAIDYYNAIYPGQHIERQLTISYMMPLLISLSLIIFFYKKIKSETRITMGFVMFTILLCVIPIMDLIFIKGENGNSYTKNIMLIATVLLAISDGICQGAIVGEASIMSELYIRSYSAGTAFVAVIITLLRIITKLCFSFDADGLRKSSLIYFSIGIIICFICFILNAFCLPKLPIVQYYKESTRYNKLEEDGEISQKSERKESMSYYLSVCKKILPIILSLILIYTVTLTIFPGVIAEDVHSEALGDWYIIILFLIFNSSDLVGKYSSNYFPVLKTQNILLCHTSVRLLFIFIFYISVVYFTNNTWIAILTLLLGLTNGYYTVSSFILAPKNFNDSADIDLIGNIAMLALIIGLCVGSLGSLLWLYLENL